MHIFLLKLLNYVTEVFQIPISACIINCSVSGGHKVKVFKMVEVLDDFFSNPVNFDFFILEYTLLGVGVLSTIATLSDWSLNHPFSLLMPLALNFI